jgi:hypothetical protein
MIFTSRLAHRFSLLMSECCDTETVECLSSCGRSRYTGTVFPQAMELG